MIGVTLLSMGWSMMEAANKRRAPLCPEQEPKLEQGTIMEGRSARNRGGNVFVELQNRQWVPAEQWNWQLLHRYCEGRTIQRLRNHVGRIGSRPQT